MLPNLGLFPSFVHAKETPQNSSNDPKPFVWILDSSSLVVTEQPSASFSFLYRNSGSSYRSFYYLFTNFIGILTAGSAKKEMPSSANPAESNLPSQVRGVLSP